MDAFSIAKIFYEEMWSKPDLDIVDVIIHPDYHPADVGMPERGPTLLIKEINYFRSIFPDLKYEIVDLTQKENKVWVRYRCTGTQKGAGWGFPASGKSVNIDEVSILTIENGQVVDSFRSYCLYRMFSQLGHIPPFWELADRLI